MKHVTTTDVSPGIAIITLDRPGKRNALLPEMIADLHGHVAALLGRDEIDALVLTGAPPAFCAGLDLAEVHRWRNDDSRRQTTMEQLLDLYQALWVSPKPVVAAVNGPAIAGGAGLVSVCDVAVAARSAVFGYTGIEHGLVPGVVMGFLAARVGASSAAYLLLTGELVDSAAAISMGLVHECVEDDRCLDRALQLARRMADFPAGAFARTKRTLRAITAGDQERNAQSFRALLTSLDVTDEAARALDGFLRDRK